MSHAQQALILFRGFRNNCAAPHFFRGSAWLGITDARISPSNGCNLHPHKYWLDVAVSCGLRGVTLMAKTPSALPSYAHSHVG